MRVFNETQKFDQWFVKMIYWGITALLVYMFYKLFINKVAFGNVAVDDWVGQFAIMATSVLTLLLIYSLKLRTTIDEIGFHYQFRPFHFSEKTIRWADMKNCKVRKYSPISEFGGWGVRISSGNGKAYNVKGNKGIQIKLQTGMKILIGTQKEKDAQQVIDRHIK